MKRVFSALTRRRSGAAMLISGSIVAAAAIPVGLVATTSAQAAPAGPRVAFTQTNLVSNLSTQGAQVQDQSLQNPWAWLSARPVRCGCPTTTRDWPPSTRSHRGHNGHQVGPDRRRARRPSFHQRRVEPNRSDVQPDHGLRGHLRARQRAGGVHLRFRIRTDIGVSPVADPVAAGMAAGQLEFSSPTAVYKGLTLVTGDDGTFLYAATSTTARSTSSTTNSSRCSRPAVSPIRHSPPATRRSASRTSTISSMSPTPSRTRSNTTMWPASSRVRRHLHPRRVPSEAPGLAGQPRLALGYSHRPQQLRPVRWQAAGRQLR